MATNPITYRVSPEVDAELKALAIEHGGVDKALRYLLNASPAAVQSQASATSDDDKRVEMMPMPLNARPSTLVFKSPLLKPSEKKK